MDISLPGTTQQAGHKAFFEPLTFDTPASKFDIVFEDLHHIPYTPGPVDEGNKTVGNEGVTSREGAVQIKKSKRH